MSNASEPMKYFYCDNKMYIVELVDLSFIVYRFCYGQTESDDILAGDS